MKNRYVITGLGQVSLLGNSIEEMKISLRNQNINFNISSSESKSGLVATINDFDFYQHGFKTKTYTDRASQLCIYAVKQVSNCLQETREDDKRIGLITASLFGCLDSAEKYLHQLKTLKKARFASPLYFTHSICNIPNSISTIECQLSGFSNHLVGSSDSGLMTLWQAIQCLEANQASCIIAGGFDALSEELMKS